MVIKDNFLAIGVGRRKTAVAIVKVYKLNLNEKSATIVNDRFGDVFLQFNPMYLHCINLPLLLLNLENNYRIVVKTRGGGLTGKTGAIVLGLSRALCSINPSYRSTLKRAGLLSRDARSVERKKSGLKKARKASQYSKR